MKSWIRPLITIFLLLAILCVCLSHRDFSLLATALRAAQAALAVVLGVIFFARLVRPWFSQYLVNSELLCLRPDEFVLPPTPATLAVLRC